MPAPVGVAGQREGDREQAIGSDDVMGRSQDRAIDEAEDREVGADGDGEESTVTNVVTGVARSARTASIRSSKTFNHECDCVNT